MVASKVVFDIISPNARTRNTVEFALQQQGKGRFELSRGNRPDLVIVDCEKPEAKVDFRKFRRRFPNCPAILLLNLVSEYDEFPEEDRIGAEFLLIKPFAVKDLITSVDQCLDSTDSNQAGNKTGLTGLTGVSGNAERTRVPGQSDQRNSTNLIARIGSKVSAAEVASPQPGKTSADDEITQKLPQGFAAEAEKAFKKQISSADEKTVSSRATKQTGVAQADENVAFTFALESDIDLSDAAAVERIWLKVDDRLLGHISRAIVQQIPAQSAICLALQGGPGIYISPHTEMVTVTGDNINLHDLAQQDFATDRVSLSMGAMPKADSQSQIGLEAFLWKLALYTYRGLLPEGVNVNEPVYLRYWPNLTRFEPTPNAMRISSLWCRQPTNLAVITRMLNIPQRHVFSFYAAASTLGLAGPARRETDRLLIPSFPSEGSESHTLIRRLASKLTSPDEVTP
jgi:hypothetical protein